MTLAGQLNCIEAGFGASVALDPSHATLAEILRFAATKTPGFFVASA